MVGLVVVAALGGLSVVAAGVVAGVAHELGTVLSGLVLTNGHVDQRAQGLIEEAELLIVQVINFQLVVIIEELPEKFQLLGTN